MRRFVKDNNSGSNNALCGFGNTISIGCGGRSYIGNLHYCTPYTTDSKGCIDRLSAYIKQKDFLTAGHGYILPEDEQKRRYAVRHILFGSGIMCEDYRKHFGKEAEEDFPVIKEWSSKGYAYIKNGFITLTEAGLALSDYLGPCFISEEVRKRMDSSSLENGGFQ